MLKKQTWENKDSNSCLWLLNAINSLFNRSNWAFNSSVSCCISVTWLFHSEIAFSSSASRDVKRALASAISALNPSMIVWLCWHWVFAVSQSSCKRFRSRWDFSSLSCKDFSRFSVISLKVLHFCSDTLTWTFHSGIWLEINLRLGNLKKRTVWLEVKAIIILWNINSKINLNIFWKTHFQLEH